MTDPNEVRKAVERLDLDKLEAVAKASGGDANPWFAGHLCDDTATCNCRYIFDEGCAGGIAEVYVDNGLPISEGGNDAPPLDYAKAIQRHIATFDPPTVLALITALKTSVEAHRAYAVSREALDAIANGPRNADLSYRALFQEDCRLARAALTKADAIIALSGSVEPGSSVVGLPSSQAGSDPIGGAPLDRAIAEIERTIGADLAGRTHDVWHRAWLAGMRDAVKIAKAVRP